MSPEHDPAHRVSSIQQLSRPEHLQLLVDLLSFFESEQDQPKAYRIRELFGRPEFQRYDEALLRQIVYSLSDSGLLYKLSHLRTRASVYVTTKMGRLVRDEYLRELKR